MIDPTTYAEIHYKAAYDYADQVAEKRIVANRWIRLAVKRFRKDLKRKVFTQDPERVKLVMKFFSLAEHTTERAITNNSSFAPVPGVYNS
jgi:phage terminase large subunit-like protein